jgi:PAS domain S-box-containing protein
MVDREDLKPKPVAHEALFSDGVFKDVLLHQFLDRNPALAFIKDENGRYVYVSKSFLEFFKVTDEAVFGKTDYQWLPEELANHFTENDNLVRRTKKTLEVIESVPSSDGDIRSIVYKFPISDGAGKDYVAGIAVDISERLKTQDLKANLAAIVDASHDAIIGATPEGIILTWNRSAQRIFGYTADEIIGKHFNILVPDKNAVYVEEILADVRNGEAVSQKEGQCLTKSGEKIYVSVTVSPILNNTSQVSGVAVVARDITQRIEMERVLKQTAMDLSIARDQALEASNLKSAFVANISHELRTPLSAILGMTELLSESKLAEEQQGYAQILKSAGQSLLTIVNDVLDLSKIEAGKMKLEYSPFNVIFLVQECARVLAPAARDKGLVLKTNIDHSIPAFVVGDHDRVRQTLINLIGNSIKFTEKGEVAVELSLQSENKELITIIFRVTDTGIGILPVEQNRLFKPFTQIDGTAARKYSGTGLGLSISKNLVEMMGGTIGFESTRGKGTQFWFTVPFKRCEKVTKIQTCTPDGKVLLDTALKGSSILLVEDNAVLQRLIQIQLSNLGVEAHAVSTGEEALEAVKQSEFDLIFMDCQLPQMDGFAATKAIRDFESAMDSYTPIVALTAGAMDGDEQRCLAAGMNDYLSKPASVRQLCDKMELWIPLKKRYHTKSQALRS